MLDIRVFGIDSNFQACIAEAARNVTLKKVEIKDLSSFEDILSSKEVKKLSCQLIVIDLSVLDYGILEINFENSTVLITEFSKQLEKHIKGDNIIRVPKFASRDELIVYLELVIKKVIDEYRKAVNQGIREICDVEYSILKKEQYFPLAFFTLANKYILANAIKMGFLLLPSNTFEEIFALGNSPIEISQEMILEHNPETPQLIKVKHHDEIIGINNSEALKNKSLVVASYIDSRLNSNYIIYEFESNLPNNVLEDICKCGSREFYRLYKEISTAKRSKVIKNITDIQRVFPDEENFYRLAMKPILFPSSTAHNHDRSSEEPADGILLRWSGVLLPSVSFRSCFHSKNLSAPAGAVPESS